MGLLGHHFSTLLLQPCGEHLSIFIIPRLDVAIKPLGGHTWQEILGSGLALNSQLRIHFPLSASEVPHADTSPIQPSSQAQVSAVTQCRAGAAAALHS